MSRPIDLMKKPIEGLMMELRDALPSYTSLDKAINIPSCTNGCICFISNRYPSNYGSHMHLNVNLLYELVMSRYASSS